MFIRRKKEMHVYKRLAAYYLFIYLCFMQLKTLDVQAGNAVASGLPDLCLRLRLLSASSSAAANLCGLCIIRQPKLDIIMPSFSCFFFLFFFLWLFSAKLTCCFPQLKLMNFQTDSGGNPLRYTIYNTIFSQSVCNLATHTQHLPIYS